MNIQVAIRANLITVPRPPTPATASYCHVAEWTEVKGCSGLEVGGAIGFTVGGSFANCGGGGERRKRDKGQKGEELHVSNLTSW